jgi:hypothetical protein
VLPSVLLPVVAMMSKFPAFAYRLITSNKTHVKNNQKLQAHFSLFSFLLLLLLLVAVATISISGLLLASSVDY